ncbi:hypothetical protein NUW58_g8835 [Xylaria curta]|uniref:Uncharacterized protein n=1 Tax=Xylaria curta TaxID=42375 RepID=A0ACC1N3I8_9PEZI|nr:hypothetical protein NUW58_g8835 [Xylaria curta]
MAPIDWPEQDPAPRASRPENLTSSSATTCAANSREISPGRVTPDGPTSHPQVSSGLKELNNSQPSISNGKAGANFKTIIDILAAEIGVESESLTDDVSLQDLGVDSIIELSVVARLQEYIPEPLPPAFLLKNNNVAKLKTFFADLV